MLQYQYSQKSKVGFTSWRDVRDKKVDNLAVISVKYYNQNFNNTASTQQQTLQTLLKTRKLLPYDWFTRSTIRQGFAKFKMMIVFYKAKRLRCSEQTKKKNLYQELQPSTQSHLPGQTRENLPSLSFQRVKSRSLQLDTRFTPTSIDLPRSFD